MLRPVFHYIYGFGGNHFKLWVCFQNPNKKILGLPPNPLENFGFAPKPNYLYGSATIKQKSRVVTSFHFVGFTSHLCGLSLPLCVLPLLTSHFVSFLFSLVWAAMLPTSSTASSHWCGLSWLLNPRLKTQNKNYSLTNTYIINVLPN